MAGSETGNMRDWELFLSEADLEDALLHFIGTLALADALKAEVVEKAKPSAELVPVKKFRLHPKYGVQLWTYYVKPAEAIAREVEELKTQAKTGLEQALKRLEEYYQQRARFYDSPEAKSYAETIEGLLKTGKKGVTKVVDDILRVFGLKGERATVTVAHNQKFLNFLIAHALRPDVKDFEFIKRAYEVVSAGYEQYNEHVNWFEEFWRNIDEGATYFRTKEIARNRETAEALQAHGVFLMGMTVDEINAHIDGMMEGREKAYRGYMALIVTFWANHTGKDVNDYAEHLAKAMRAHGRVSRTWGRLLKAEISELGLRAAALSEIAKERGISVQEAAKTVKADELRAKVNELAGTDVYAEIANLRTRLTKERDRAFRAKARLIKRMAADFNDPDVGSAIASFVDITLNTMKREKWLQTRIENAKQAGQEVKPEWETQLTAVRRFRAHLKDLMGDLGTAMLVNAFTGKEMVKGDDIRGAIKELWQRASSPESFVWRRDWQASYCARISEAVDNLLGRDRSHERQVMSDLIRQYPDAPEEALKFIVRARTGGQVYKDLVRIIRGVRAGGADMPIKATHVADILSAF